jgi:NAD(P)-dependent dehydrogenase (short-subunit alcohol dehydrogenase family)
MHIDRKPEQKGKFMQDSKVVVITGASRGLGLSFVQEFTAHGWKAIGTGRSEQPNDFPTGAVYEQFDASDPKACAAFWEAAKNSYPNASFCLVNNAGVYVSGGLRETSADDYLKQMQGNFFSAVYMTKVMAEVVPSARIINIISSSALKAHKENSAYGASKAAEAHFFQSLQQEFKPEDYRITNLYPSDIATHGEMPDAIDPADLAMFAREQAENESTYYLRDVTMYPAAKVDA